VNGGDVRVVRRGKRPGFARKSSRSFGILREGLRKELERDAPTQLGVGRLVDVAQPPDPRWALIS
jgi:hypothetical protein